LSLLRATSLANLAITGSGAAWTVLARSDEMLTDAITLLAAVSTTNATAPTLEATPSSRLR
jgi:hypothetical protein